MPMVRIMRMLNAMEAGTLSGASLETMLSNDTSRVGELNAILNMRGQAQRVAASATTVNALASSATALQALTDSSVGFAAVLASELTSPLVVLDATRMDTFVTSANIMRLMLASTNTISDIYSDATLKSKFRNSTVFTSITPAMTSNTTPSPGVVTCSGGADPYKALQAGTPGQWQSSADSEVWIAYDFGKDVAINELVLQGSTNNDYHIGNFTLQASDDGRTWEDIISGYNSGNRTTYEVASVRKQHWRLNMGNRQSYPPVVYEFLPKGWEL